MYPSRNLIKQTRKLQCRFKYYLKLEHWKDYASLHLTLPQSACPSFTQSPISLELLETSTYQTGTLMVWLCSVVYNRTKLQKLWWLGNWTTLFSNGFLKFYLNSPICEAWRRRRERRGRGGGDGRASVRPRRRRIVSPRRRVAHDVCLQARSLRYAAGLRRSVTRHVWRDRRCYACVWCSIKIGYCSSVVIMHMC